MGKHRISYTLGGCLGGTLGGLLGIAFGVWIACKLVSTHVDVPEFKPPTPILLLMQIYMLAYGVPAILGATAGGIVGYIAGSLAGGAIVARMQVTPDVAAAEAADRPIERDRWVKCAIYGLIAIGVFGVLLSTLSLFSEDDKAQPIPFMIWALLGVASGIMLSKRIRAGKILGIVFVLPGVLLFPHGTLVALLLLYALCCSQTTRYLSNYSEQESL